jgi:hypothetical protein
MSGNKRNAPPISIGKKNKFGEELPASAFQQGPFGRIGGQGPGGRRSASA